MAYAPRLKGAERATVAQDLAENYTAGNSIRALMDRTGRSFGTVYRLLNEAGVEFRPPGRHPHDDDRAAERADVADDLAQRYTAGATIRGLAERTGRSYGTVHQLLTEAGVELRRVGRP